MSNHIAKFLIPLLLAQTCYALEQSSAPELASSIEAKPQVTAKHAMIVTNNKYATQAANEILQAGGNAFDAAIAAGFVLGLTEPQSSGIGGGGYAITYQGRHKQLQVYDGREVAPASATADWFLDEKQQPLPFKQAVLSTKSIGVPGEVALFYKLHQKQGKLAWSKLLQPAITLANNGFEMSPRLHKLLSADIDLFKNNVAVKNIYFNGNDIKPINSIIKNKPYAETLTIIAKQPTEFYRGKLANSIIDDINKNAGKNIYHKNDFANYQVVLHPALCKHYRTQYQICTVPPSSGGGVTLLELMTMYATRIDAHQYDDINWTYYFLESSKLAYADRNQYLADPAFIPQPVRGLLANDYLQARATLITDRALTMPVAAGTPQGVDPLYAPDNHTKEKGTTSLVIVDRDNNAISMTVTVESQFGSHLFTHGFFLNNELTDFSFTAKNDKGRLIANRVEPGKRPRSSITPVIVFKNDKLHALSGSPGGSEIICYVAKNLILMLDMNLGPASASAKPNLCAASRVVLESNKSPAYLQNLKQRGEEISDADLVSGVTNIIRHGDAWLGAADPRREGVAM